MNVHYLELFYYVAKHGGITSAVRHMPYGIQQPAISGQILQLEDFLGLKLFHRRPFSLTPGGQELFAFIEPFFGRLPEVSARLRGEANQRLRLAASAVALREHVPLILPRVRARFPQLRLVLRETNQAQAEELIQKQQVDLAVCGLEGKPAPGLRCTKLLELPLILLVPGESPLRSAQELWRRGEVDEPLVGLPPTEAISRAFQAGLRKIKFQWLPSVEVSSMDLVHAYVAGGFGIGVTLKVPGSVLPPKIRTLPLPGFPALVVAAFWQGKLPPVADAFLEEAKAHIATVVRQEKR